MRGKKERIRLDGMVVSVVKPCVFVVELENQHGLLGIVKSRLSGKIEEFGGLKKGDRVVVETSPCDMSRGMIVSCDTGG